MAKGHQNKMSSHEDARRGRISDRNQCVVMVPITSSNQQQQSSYTGLNIFKVSNDPS